MRNVYLSLLAILTRSKRCEQGFSVGTWPRRAVSCGTPVAGQRCFAARDVLALLGMHEGRGQPAAEPVAVDAVPEPVVLVAVAIHAAVGLNRHALGVAHLAGDLGVCADQRLRVREVLAADPGEEVVAVLARPPVGVRRAVAVAAVLGSVGTAGASTTPWTSPVRRQRRAPLVHQARVASHAELPGTPGAAVLEGHRRRRAQGKMFFPSGRRYGSRRARRRSWGRAASRGSVP